MDIDSDNQDEPFGLAAYRIVPRMSVDSVDHESLGDMCEVMYFIYELM